MLIADFITLFFWASSCIGFIWITLRGTHDRSGPVALDIDQLHRKCEFGCFQFTSDMACNSFPRKIYLKNTVGSSLWPQKYHWNIADELHVAVYETSALRYRYSKILEKLFEGMNGYWSREEAGGRMQNAQECRAESGWGHVPCNHINSSLVKKLKKPHTFPLLMK